MSGETTQHVRDEMREVLEAFLRFMPKVLRSPWFVEADKHEVDEGLAVCARAEAILGEREVLNED